MVRGDVHGVRDGASVALGSRRWAGKFGDLRSDEASFEACGPGDTSGWEDANGSCSTAAGKSAAGFAESETVKLV